MKSKEFRKSYLIWIVFVLMMVSTGGVHAQKDPALPAKVFFAAGTPARGVDLRGGKFSFLFFNTSEVGVRRNRYSRCRFDPRNPRGPGRRDSSEEEKPCDSWWGGLP